MKPGAPPAISDAAGEAGTRPLPITQLLSYKLSRVANALSRSATLRYRRQFDVSLGEWRAIALLGESAPQTLNRLARMAALDKAQMSRVISGLTERGIVRREQGPRRTTQLSLTRRGRNLYEGLIAAANERNDAFLVCLTPEEQIALDSALEKLATLARALERSESS